MADKHPQWLKARVVESAAGTFTTQEVETPVISGPNNFYVMSVLDIYYEVLMADGAQLVTAKETGASVQLTRNVETALLSNTNDDVIFFGSQKFHTLTSGSTSYGPKQVIMHDGQGNGVLIADKSIQLSIQGDGDNAAACTCNLWIKYKLTKVSAQDLLDMLAEV